MRSHFRRRRWRNFATPKLASSFRTIACCRSVLCWKTCSCRPWSHQTVPAEGATRSRARQLIEQVGLADRVDHRPGELSGGEKQRVAIARALIRQPRLVLCDEPTGNLDQQSASVVASLLLDLHRRQQNILVVVTHSERLAAQFPIRFEIADGRLRRIA